MQIVIEIPKSEIPKYQDIIEIPLHFIDGKVCEAGGYDFDVLPKGHGRLIDADALEDLIKHYDISYKSDLESADIAHHYGLEISAKKDKERALKCKQTADFLRELKAYKGAEHESNNME